MFRPLLLLVVGTTQRHNASYLLFLSLINVYWFDSEGLTVLTFRSDRFYFLLQNLFFFSWFVNISTICFVLKVFLLMCLLFFCIASISKLKYHGIQTSFNIDKCQARKALIAKNKHTIEPESLCRVGSFVFAVYQQIQPTLIAGIMMIFFFECRRSFCGY